jgi:hypothetical protein
MTYLNDKRKELPQPIKRFAVEAWSTVSDFAHSRKPDVTVIVLAQDSGKAEDTIRQLKPDFEALAAHEATAEDTDRFLLLNDFRDKYNTR